MSQRLISLSEDLRQLRDEGYDIRIQRGFLVVRNVPYLNRQREVCSGTLVSELTLAGDVTARPSTHVVHFAGEYPCDAQGAELGRIRNKSARNVLADDLVVDHTFSSKPASGYRDYYEKITTYIAILTKPVGTTDADVSARTYPVVESEEDELPFQYVDTATSRARVGSVVDKLELLTVAIVGLGGTGSYILDLVAKSPVRGIHLFDDDRFYQHSAFRSPGAPAIAELRDRPYKVDYYRQVYSRLKRGIVGHNYLIDETNVAVLGDMDFVFVCIDDRVARRTIVEHLTGCATDFIDVGMGVRVDPCGTLGGVLRVTASSNRMRGPLPGRMPLGSGAFDDAYATNIQIAELNALNAVLAVIKWKKMSGVYTDLEDEHHVTYTIDGNMLVNDDLPEQEADALST